MSVTAASGFAAAGVSAGIRPSGKPDVALVRSLVPSVGCAMWTTNRVQAAPVSVSRRHLEVAQPQAVVVNAGVANAATGRGGEDDAEQTAVHAAARLGLAPEQVLVLSTGVIGPRLPMPRLLAGVDEAAAALSPGGGPSAAEAILTTDASAKTAVASRDGFTVGGMAKGAGMIHPLLATMLAVVTTDYPLAEGEPDAFLRPAVERTFNRISVDGDCSTNDAVVLLARRIDGERVEAILTTDASAKTAVASRDGFTVGGMAKGAGMIHPQLATMLAVVTTDYPLAEGEPDEFLRPAVERTFNRISVDGDCSTNDAVVLLARRIDGERVQANDASFAEALEEVCADLARQIVADGEGATVVLEIAVRGASSDAQAHAIALRIATSALVKTAAFGRDPNWGRVLAAAGSAPWNGGFAELDPERLRVSFDGTAVFDGGAPTGLVPKLAGGDATIELDLGLGDGACAYLASDLSYDYVRLNAEYTT